MKRILGFLAAALLATSALGAEVTTTGLLGVSGESGLVDGAVVTAQSLTFKPTAQGGAILLQVFDQADQKELLRHMVPIKNLTLNGVNTILDLRQIPAEADAAAVTVSDNRVIAYSAAINLRVEISLVGKVTGEFGGAKLDGLGDGLFVWTVSTALPAHAVNAEPFFATVYSSSNPNYRAPGQGIVKNGAFGAANSAATAICKHICSGGSLPPTNACGAPPYTNGDPCTLACNCVMGGAGNWNDGLCNANCD